MLALNIEAKSGSPLAWSCGALRPAGVVALALCLFAAPDSGFAAAAKLPPSPSQAALNKYDHATMMRQELEGMPHASRTRREYERVMDAYRAVYHGDPASAKADASIAAVAELLAEEGRLFADRKPLEDAVGQYEFLRKQYPASSLRPKALLIEADILAQDLDDHPAAASKLREFLKSYPHSDVVPQVRRQLSALNHGGSAPVTHKLVMAEEVKPALHVNPLQPASIANSAKPATRIAAAPPPTVSQDAAESQDEEAPPPVRATYSSGREPRPAVLTEISQSQTPPALHTGHVILVTDIRHWSTPTSTRIVIDLGDEVHFQTGRVLNPDRIYFDLYHARLVPQLLGHMITVQNDAFLRNIRVSQYTPDVARIVLDVGPIAEYTAFLLPNPYRLIVDVHARKSGEPAPTEQGGAPALRARPDTTSDNAPAPTPAITRPVQPSAPTRSNAPPPAYNPPFATAPTPPSKPKTNSDGVTLDENGHETGVANPPADVTTTPSDEDLPPPSPAPKPSTTPQQNISGKKPAQTGHPKSPPQKPVPQKADPSQNEVAILDPKPEVVRATRKPTTQPIVAEVTAPNDDATDTPPFAKSVVPGAAPQSAASASSAASKANAAATPKSKPAKHKRGQPAASQPDAQLMEVHEAEPTATGERSLVRALGLKIGRIVIDPGHGGHDAGTVGPDGLEEKDVVLDVGLRLGKLLQQRLGADVTYTRSTDVFIPLETRTAIANKAQADLFVSIHANSSKDESARGVETYYLNFTSSPDALDVAARENAVSEKSIHELQDLVKKITLKDKIDESREFAADVEHSLYMGVSDTRQNEDLKDRGVKKAPFVVLIGANMPSILTEISFVSNPEDARELREGAYRQRIAESLYAGIAKYINGLSSVHLAENRVHGTGN